MPARISTQNLNIAAAPSDAGRALTLETNFAISVFDRSRSVVSSRSQLDQSGSRLKQASALTPRRATDNNIRNGFIGGAQSTISGFTRNSMGPSPGVLQIQQGVRIALERPVECQSARSHEVVLHIENALARNMVDGAIRPQIDRAHFWTDLKRF